MQSPGEKLAQSLKALQKLQDKGRVAIRGTELHRRHRERLLEKGFLKEIIKGWYLPTPSEPTQEAGESVAWATSYWSFCSEYLQERFGNDWYLSPEQSIYLHVSNRNIPVQLSVRASRGQNNITKLPRGMSIMDLRFAMPPKADIETKDGLNVLRLPVALACCPEAFLGRNAIDVKAALSMINDASEILPYLLSGGKTVIAGRLAGGFRSIGQSSIAEQIVQTMRSAGYDCRETNPFEGPVLGSSSALVQSEHANVLIFMWSSMRQVVLDCFPNPPGLPADKAGYLNRVQENYKIDAYHSLSIEGYRVSSELIDRVRDGVWNPDINEKDRELRDALAARGYYLAYESVKQSVNRVLNGENPGDAAKDDHPIWYRELFMPSVSANLAKPSDLAGYRNSPVYVRGSRYIPPKNDAVCGLMSALFDLLRDESEPAVRVVLGHFLFVHIHPYLDGNGRVGRFLMNLMLASGGYPWTVIPVTRRNEYMVSLEEASVNRNIQPFSEFIAALVKETMEIRHNC